MEMFPQLSFFDEKIVKSQVKHFTNIKLLFQNVEPR
ncbi:hypothetical protein LI6934_07105 [Bacillus licheniformis LMG 6934]|nr:hypothetical protein LI6934_07105 [Bacillus licheniformis LMG 6934]